MCYESPVIRAEATRLARDVIGAEIAAQVGQLEADGLAKVGDKVKDRAKQVAVAAR